MSVFVGLSALFALLVVGMPVAFAMAVAGAIGLYMIGGQQMVSGILLTAPLSEVMRYELITIPMFLLMAEFVLLSRIANDLFAAVAAWVGRLRGGLGMATSVAGAGFGAICGSSLASAVTLSATSLPAMIKQNYEPKMAAGVVAVSGTLAMLIPPSVALILYGLLAEVNIGKLLIAGIVPGIIVMFTIMATVWVLAWLDPTRAPIPAPTPLKEKIRLLRIVAPMLVLFMMVTGIIYTGIATPTEASALGAFGAFLLLLLRGNFTRRELGHAILRACYASCMIGMILIGAHIFGYFFALTRVTQNLVLFVGEMNVEPWMVIFLLLVVYLILGTFMDQIAILVLTVPVALPLVVSLGYDPIWFGIIIIITAEVGLITPPVGLNCFVIARQSGQPVAEVFAGAFPHVVAHILVLFVLAAFPAIILWLPSQM